MSNFELQKIDVEKEARILSEAAGHLLYPRNERESGQGFQQLHTEVARLSEENLRLVVSEAQKLHEEAFASREKARRDIVAATRGSDEELDKARRNLSDKDMALRLTPAIEIVYENNDLEGVKVSSGRRSYFVEK